MPESLYEIHNEKTKQNPYIFGMKGIGCPLHWHENLEILLFKMPGVVFCGEEKYEVSPGELVVISSGVIHAVTVTPETEYTYIIVDEKLCSDNLVDYKGLSFAPVITDETAIALFKRIVQEITSEDKYSEANARALLITFVVYLCRNFSSEAIASCNKTAKKAIGYMNSKIGEKITMDEVAEFVNMSKYHFCRMFRKETGYTVVGYINLMRCIKAERLITRSGFTVSEAARACGFDNASYFSRTFRNVMGYLPVACKKHARGAEALKGVEMP